MSTQFAFVQPCSKQIGAFSFFVPLHILFLFKHFAQNWYMLLQTLPDHICIISHSNKSKLLLIMRTSSVLVVCNTLQHSATPWRLVNIQQYLNCDKQMQKQLNWQCERLSALQCHLKWLEKLFRCPKRNPKYEAESWSLKVWLYPLKMLIYIMISPA